MRKDRESLFKLKPQEQDQRRICPNCAGFARLTYRFLLDPRQDGIVRLYECQCGERMWND